VRHLVILLVAVVGISVSAFAPTQGWPPTPGHTTIDVWPHGAPGAPANLPPESDTTTAKDNLIAGKPIIRLGNVSTPTLTLYWPTGKSTGAAIVVFPGGGYRILAIDLEGTEVCDWLNSAGITCVLLKYRVPDTGPYPKSAAALQDAQRALGIVRSHAAEWHIDAHRLGVLGFSAGGHLAAALSTQFDKRIYDRIDAADELSCRPDFAILCYPVITFEAPYCHKGSRENLIGKNPDPKLLESLCNEKQVTEKTPPTFLFHTNQDTGVPPENSVLFYMALRKAKVPAELHVYEKGAHGVGLAPRDPVLSSWPKRLADWLKVRGLLTPPGR